MSAYEKLIKYFKKAKILYEDWIKLPIIYPFYNIDAINLKEAHKMINENGAIIKTKEVRNIGTRIITIVQFENGRLAKFLEPLV